MSDAVFFTADTHFNHAKCQELFRAGRFTSVEAMNETIVERWNSRVKKGDRVYHLGDVALGSPAAAAAILSRLNGQIFLIRGNHDRVAEHRLCKDRFVWIKDYFGLRVGEQKIQLCHYAFRTWNQMHRGSWHLHGHSHGTLPELETLRAFDVGVDCWDFYPVSYDEVAAKMATKRFEPVDGHRLEAFSENQPDQELTVNTNQPNEHTTDAANETDCESPAEPAAPTTQSDQEASLAALSESCERRMCELLFPPTPPE